jgi:hypothetical protein
VTLPIPSTVFADGELTNEAKWYLRVFQAINSIYATQQSSPLGIIGLGSGPASSTDYTSVAAAVTVNADVVAGRSYRVTGSTKGTQITAAGTTISRLQIAAAEVGRMIGNQFGATSLNSTPEGTFEWTYQPGATATVAFTLTGESSAGAFRVAGNNCQITVEDIGVL